MRHGDIGPGGHGAGGKLWPGFLTGHGPEMWGVRGLEIRRQSNGQNMPQIAVFHCTRMQFSPDQGGEIRVPERHCIGHRIAIDADEMIGQRDEIIAFRLVPATYLGGLQNAVGQGGMGVQVATVKLAGGGKGGCHQRVLAVRMCHVLTPVCDSFQYAI